MFAPAEWGLADSQPFDLDGLLAGTAFPASARFQATSRHRRWLGLFTLSGLILAGYVGWQGVQTHQEALRQAALRAAWLAQQQANTSPALRLPWHDAPRVRSFIGACAERWQKSRCRWQAGALKKRSAHRKAHYDWRTANPLGPPWATSLTG
ncbi:type 4b pilus protein PilO2 [Candidatus Williamhamiltonella defendens]|uniref:Uncharacterized protein n=1 Tax=Candidatus Williamhamiltonella defendens TaxID=138072 RepID=A0A2D3TGA8_9ENTR|nr:hypothetical protein BJP43_10685 [Candidatus Hamiltonella defensa]